jgi:riboflavin biosynthesis pyrimidine reductase
LIRQYLNAGIVDEIELSIAPILLGDGERPLDGVQGVELEQIRVVEAPGVTHITYGVTSHR